MPLRPYVAFKVAEPSARRNLGPVAVTVNAPTGHMVSPWRGTQRAPPPREPRPPPTHYRGSGSSPKWPPLGHARCPPSCQHMFFSRLGQDGALLNNTPPLEATPPLKAQHTLRRHLVLRLSLTFCCQRSSTLTLMTCLNRIPAEWQDACTNVCLEGGRGRIITHTHFK